VLLRLLLVRDGFRLVRDVRVAGAEGGEEGEEGCTPADTFVSLSREASGRLVEVFGEAERKKKKRRTFHRLLFAASPYWLMTEVMEESPTTERSCSGGTVSGVFMTNRKRTGRTKPRKRIAKDSVAPKKAEAGATRLPTRKMVEKRALCVQRVMVSLSFVREKKRGKRLTAKRS
jgi:hypothetical protein